MGSHPRVPSKGLVRAVVDALVQKRTPLTTFAINLGQQ